MYKKERYRIEPFRHRVDLEPDYKEKTWTLLENSMVAIFNHNPSKLSFEELYRSAYNMVLHKFGSYLYDNVVRTISAHLETVGREVETKNGEAFLQLLVHSWSDYTRAMRNIRDILMYMNKTYVKQHSKTPIHELGLELWNEHLLQRPLVRSILKQVILEAVLKFRSCRGDRKKVESHQGNPLITAVTKMAMDIGQKVYEEVVEVPIQLDTRAFYRSVSQQEIADLSCPAYLRSVRESLEDESRMVDLYLFDTSRAKIITTVEDEMIENRLDVLITMDKSGLLHQLRERNLEDLDLVYTMLRRSPTGHPRMIDLLKSHVMETGACIIGQKVATTNDSLQVVNQLVEERALYDTIIRQCFHADKAFATAVQSCFEKFLNTNPRTPELLSIYLDTSLRKDLKGKSDEEAEAVIDRVMTLFRYLHEKDVFERYYKQHLAKRLLTGRTQGGSSEDHERSVILKLKTECGYQFTSKLESMFNDIRTSQDIMSQYKREDQADQSAGTGGVELSVQVLTTGSWPIDKHAQFQVPLPETLQQEMKSFEEFYLKTHNGRKLAWQTNMGHGEVRAGGFADGKKHDLILSSTLQIAVLTLFSSEEVETLAYRDIRSSLGAGVPESELKRTLQSLACIKGKNVLRKDPQGKEVDEADAFAWNAGFKSNQYRIRIQQISSAGTGAGGSGQGGSGAEADHDLHARVREDRKPQVEAAIVRVMKMRRELQVQVLIGEVASMLKGRFLPEVSLVKQRIESLIEREFLERDREDGRIVRYVS